MFFRKQLAEQLYNKYRLITCIALHYNSRSRESQWEHLLSKALEQRMDALICGKRFAASTLILHVDGVIGARHGTHRPCSPWKLREEWGEKINTCMLWSNHEAVERCNMWSATLWRILSTCGRVPSSPATTSSSASRSEAARTFWRSCCCSSLEENIKSSSSIPASFVITWKRGTDQMTSDDEEDCLDKEETLSGQVDRNIFWKALEWIHIAVPRMSLRFHR